MSLKLSLLGPFEISVNGAPATGFNSNKVRALLAYVAIERDRPHERGRLAAMLWPDHDERRALTNLRNALSNLRTALGDLHREQPHVLSAQRGLVRFDPGADTKIDLIAFEDRCSRAESHAHRRAAACPDCARWLTLAADLYRGPFLEGFVLGNAPAFDDWLLLHRERSRQKAGAALTRLVEHHEVAGNVDAGLELATRLLAMDPWREEAHRLVMRLHAQRGDRSAALRQYERCRDVLDRELGVEPTGDTVALYHRILDERGIEPTPTAAIRAPVTPLIGRREALEALVAELADPRCQLVTLVGPGGVGKTRLALQAAARMAPHFRDGTLRVPLESVDEEAGVARAIATALDRDRDAADLMAIARSLRNRRMLVLLDNCEHQVAACAKLVDALAAASPRSCVLATSRRALLTNGERVQRVVPLALAPDSERGHADAKPSAAARLFEQRARAVRRDFELVPESVGAVEAACRSLDGLPLAIELAAARIDHLSVSEIRDRLALRPERLRDERRGQRPGHATLEDVLSWSRRLLDRREQRLLERLSVFRGGWTLPAAEAVCAGGELGGDHVLEAMGTLVRSSLVERSGEGEASRYDMLRTVRLHAARWLEQRGEQEVVEGRHLQWCSSLVEDVIDATGAPDATLWRAVLGPEELNLRVALGRANLSAQTRLHLAALLARYWQRRGLITEGRAWLSELLLIADGAPAGIVAEGRLGAGALAAQQGEYGKAKELLQAALAAFRSLGDDAGAARAMRHLGTVADERGQFEEAVQWYEASLALLGAAEDRWGQAALTNNLGMVAFGLGQLRRAHKHLHDSLSLFQALGERWAEAVTLTNLGHVALDRGDVDDAERLLGDALAITRELSDHAGEAFALTALGDVARHQERLQEARSLYGEAATLARQFSDRRFLAEWLEAVAALLDGEGSADLAAQRLAEAECLRRVIEAPITPKDRARLHALRRRLDTQLGDAGAEAARSVGHARASMALAGGDRGVQSLVMDALARPSREC